MAKRSEVINRESLSGLLGHHPYLQILQKEDWQQYLLLLAEIYDVLEEQSGRVAIEVVRALAMSFYSATDLASPEQKVGAFLNMAIGELEILKDSHDQFAQRYIETTRSGKLLLQLFEGLIAQRSKFSGTGAETLLGALNDILIQRKQMSVEEAIQHHRDSIAALKEDIARIQDDGLAAAQLLPLAHSNEALFVQAEEAAVHVMQSIEDVKNAIEQQRRELASSYFREPRSAGETLGAVADFYHALYASPAYASYIQAKDLLSYLEGFQTRFSARNIDRLLHTIGARQLVLDDLLRKSNLHGFMRQFLLADASIQDKIKAQLRILQQQVLYAVSTDVEGLRSTLHELLSRFVSHTDSALDFLEQNALSVVRREEFVFGPVELFAFELPVEVQAETLAEEVFDSAQQRELFLTLLRAEEGTLKDILARLREHLETHGELRAGTYFFPKGLPEYYVLSEIELFDSNLQKIPGPNMDLTIESKHGAFVLRQVPDFVLRRKEAQ